MSLTKITPQEIEKEKEYFKVLHNKTLNDSEIKKRIMLKRIKKFLKGGINEK